MGGTDDIASSCTCFAVRRAARHVTQAYDRVLAPSGLRISQLALLSRLASSGPRSIGALADEMGLDRTTLGRNLRPLERDGLVAITVDPLDRRGRALQLTPAGQARRAEAALLWAAAEARFAASYGVAETASLHATLNAVSSLRLA